MKKFYYFSNKKLNFIEIKNFYRKLTVFVTFSAILSSFLILGTYFVVTKIIYPEDEVVNLKIENHELHSKLEIAIIRLKKYDSVLDSMSNLNNDLRIAANLPPLTEEDLNFGTGGKSFNKVTNIKSESTRQLVDELDKYLTSIESKVLFEKSNYIEIKNKLQSNQDLYASIPVLKPTDGTISLNGFGMRKHPVLGVYKMHDGVDIITRTGTAVYAPGKGKVVFVGRRYGYGLTVEIDHGYGYRTLYGHLSSSHVNEGATVLRGDLIARTGNSGELTTGPHLHYEVHHDGVKKDPENFMFGDISLFDSKN